jgi:murein DD-endopeptidase MepM/ murein hydrolase activator NlpD
MAQRPNSLNQQSEKPSRLLMLVALVIALSLPYLLVKNFSHPKKEIDEFKTFTISTPELTSSIEEAVNKADAALELVNNDTPQDIVQNIPKVTVDKTKEAVAVVKSPPKVKDNEWQTVRPRPGDSMATIFHRLGLSAKNLHEVLRKNPHAKALTAIKPSQELKFLINKNRLEKLIIPVNYIDTLNVVRTNKGYQFNIDSKKTTTQNLYVTATVQGSLYNTAQRANIPYKFITKMTEILKREVDFSHGLRSGDQFSIVYDAYYVGNKMVGMGDIVAVSYTSNDKTTQAFRHTSSNGTVDYYSPQGNSFKKAFTRYPIKFSHISSTFALSRYHPILHYKRAHKGIDLAAPIGTPIQATGDGVIAVIDRHNGYGNMIKIKHDKTYSTIYGHMLKFQKGLSKGSRVKRGQIIGYVGQTGLASGPHCHYELHVNDQPRNPTTTNLPTASPLAGRELKAFKTRTGTLIARLKLFEAAHLASKGKKIGVLANHHG